MMDCIINITEWLKYIRISLNSCLRVLTISFCLHTEFVLNILIQLRKENVNTKNNVKFFIKGFRKQLFTNY